MAIKNNIKNNIKNISIVSILLTSLTLVACGSDTAKVVENTKGQENSGLVDSVNTLKNKASQVGDLSKNRNEELETAAE